MRRLFVAIVALALSVSSASADVARVLATTKPVHALVAAVMGELGPPTLLVRGAASAHAYSLKPSDAAALEQATLIFRVGAGFELFLEGALETLAADAEVVDLASNPAVELLPLRDGGAFGPHGAQEGDDGHANEAADMHFWLDPVNATLMLSHIADALTVTDPEHADTYLANASAEIERIRELTSEIEVMLAPVKAKPLIVFHDATQYFERRFGLAVIGSITVSPDVMPGAQRIAGLRQAVAESGAPCVFAEPNFESAIVATLVEGTPAKAGTLDPEGALLTEGPALYRDLLAGLARSFVDCLSAAGP